MSRTQKLQAISAVEKYGAAYRQFVDDYKSKYNITNKTILRYLNSVFQAQVMSCLANLGGGR